MNHYLSTDKSACIERTGFGASCLEYKIDADVCL